MPVAEDVKPPAESSPTGTTDAAVEASSPSPEPNFDPETYTAEEADEWRKTGAVPELAEAPKPQAESAPATEPPAGAPEPLKPGDKPATESAPVSQQEKPKGKSNADTRKAELAREIQDLLRQKAALKAEIATPAKTEAPAKPDVAVAEPSPAPKLPKVEKPVKPTKPIAPFWGEKADEDWEQFEVRAAKHKQDEAKYETDLDQYHEQQIGYVLAEDRRAREKERLDAETETQNRAIKTDWENRVAALKEEDGIADAEWDALVAPLYVKDKPPIPTGSVADGFILDSTVGAKLVLYFARHLDEAEAVGHMAPLKAVRILVMLEQSLLHPPEPEPAAQPEPESPPKPKPVVRTITQAARPARDLRATNPAPIDELQAAVAADDFERFSAIQNRADIERRKRG